MIYTPEDLRVKFKVAKETIRQWSIEFEEYLSPRARPGAGKHRLYDDDDVTVFALVAEMKERGITYDEIRVSLANGQRGTPPEGGTPFMTLAPAQEQQMALIQGRILELEDEVERLKPFETDVAVERALRKSAEERLREAQDEIARLNREIGRLSKDGE